MARLLDQFGQWIPDEEIWEMQSQIARTSSIHGRPPFPGHLAPSVDPGRLAGIIRAADGGSTLEYRILEQEVEELFPHYFAVLSKRRRQVCQLPITVVAAGDDDAAKKHADFVTEWLETDCLQSGLFDLTDLSLETIRALEKLAMAVDCVIGHLAIAAVSAVGNTRAGTASTDARPPGKPEAQTSSRTTREAAPATVGVPGPADDRLSNPPVNEVLRESRPSAPAAAIPNRGGYVWTVERDAAFLAMRAQGKLLKQCLEPLNAMPGKPIGSVRALEQRSLILRRRDSDASKPAAMPVRPQQPVAVAEPRIAKVPPPVPTPSPSPPVRPLIETGGLTDYQTIRAWAHQHGLRFDGTNMDQVNQIRRRFAYPPFQLDGNTVPGAIPRLVPGSA